MISLLAAFFLHAYSAPNSLSCKLYMVNREAPNLEREVDIHQVYIPYYEYRGVDGSYPIVILNSDFYFNSVDVDFFFKGYVKAKFRWENSPWAPAYNFTAKLSHYYAPLHTNTLIAENEINLKFEPQKFSLRLDSNEAELIYSRIDCELE